MGFWGTEVKPGETQVFQPQIEEGKLHLTHATLGEGLGKERSVVQVSVGDSDPIFVCSLLPNKIESCSLNLEFDDEDESVEFSVTGNRSIHLTGYLEAYDHEDEQEDEDDDSDGIDLGESESSEFDSEDEERMNDLEELIDSNLERYRRASAPNSGVVIEEIEDEEKPAKESKTKQPKKKIQAIEDVNLLESEDEDGFPVSKEIAPEPETKTDTGEQGSNKKRKAKAAEQDGAQESVSKNKKKKNQKEKVKPEISSVEEADEQVQSGNVQKKQESSQTPSSAKAKIETVNDATTESSKKNKKKNKKNPSEEATVESKTSPSSVEKPKADSNSKSSRERTYPNGLVVEELAMGKPNAKKANPGSQVSVRYIGKLQKNGKIFDSNIGKAPFKFRLGVGKVIKGWDVGVQGMRVGDKRKLTIPPSMGYGAEGIRGGPIPPNAWLVFDVELIDVK